MIGIGVMSGSSLDGIDAALVSIEEKSYRFLQTESFQFPSQLKDQLRKASELNLKEYLHLEQLFSKFIAESIKACFTVPYEFISIHGHTTFHLPESGISHQMINGGIVSALTEKKVITDFRIGDVSLGGVGTPLVPILEKHLLVGYDYFLNLGGIANLTDSESWKAFDVCPCNQLGNFLCKDTEDGFDRDSKLAFEGKLNSALYNQLNDFDYYSRTAPKSLDNNWIKENYFQIFQSSIDSTSNKLLTTNRWIADKILEKLATAKTIYLSGGGSYNNQLVKFLKENDQSISIHVPSKEMIEFKEALLMAYVGYLRLESKFNILSSATGAKSSSIGGAIYNAHGN